MSYTVSKSCDRLIVERVLESRIPWIPILVLVVSAALVVVLVTSFIDDSAPASDLPAEFETSTPGEPTSVGASLTALREELTALQEDLRPAIQARDDFITSVEPQLDEFRKARALTDEVVANMDLSIESMINQLPVIIESELRGELTYGNVIRRSFVLTGLFDEEELPVFTIRTTNEEGDTDGGFYGVQMHVLVGQGLIARSGVSASKTYIAAFSRQMVQTGNGTNSGVTINGSSASASNNPGLRDVGDIEMRAIETSEYETEVRLTADLLGSNPLEGVTVVSIELVYYGFATPPQLLESDSGG